MRVVYNDSMQNNLTDQQLAQIVWDYMNCQQPLQKADVIIGFGSFYQGTADWCAKLWQDGWAPRIIFCGNTGTFSDADAEPEAERYAARARDLGVDDKAIIVEPASRNSGENIVLGYAELQRQGVAPERVILVTAPFFLRRMYATAAKQWPGERMPQFICSSDDRKLAEYMEDADCPSDIIDIIVGNLGRMTTYAEQGFQIEQDIPHDVWTVYEELVRRGYTKHLLAN